MWCVLIVKRIWIRRFGRIVKLEVLIIMNYRDFCFQLLKVNTALRIGELSPDEVDVMVTKSSGDTLIVFMDKNSNEPVTYFKVE